MSLLVFKRPLPSDSIGPSQNEVYLKPEEDFQPEPQYFDGFIQDDYEAKASLIMEEEVEEAPFDEDDALATLTPTSDQLL
jgi:hypothetical protein